MASRLGDSTATFLFLGTFTVRTGSAARVAPFARQRVIPLSRQRTDRERMWQLLELTEDPETGEAEWDWVDILLVVLIMLSLVAVVLETLEGFYEQWHEVFITFELFVVAVFTVEYALRLWSCTADPRYAAPVRGRVRYALSFFGIIDALAILPFYVSALFPVAVLDLLFLRALRLVRFVRVLKLGRYSEATDRMKAVFLAKRADLGVALFMVFLVLIIASSVMYHIENPVQPEVFSSIPAAMWWGVSTLTTVGYGDVMPITPLGKLLGHHPDHGHRILRAARRHSRGRLRGRVPASASEG